MPSIKLIITDLDNTLYNWIDFYVPSFLSMVRELSKLSGIDDEDLKASFKRVHQQHKTTEYTFAIQELDVLKDQTCGLTGREIVEKYSTAIQAFRKTRKQTLRVYDGVIDTFTRLKGEGKKIAAVTDALRFHVEYRLNQLGIAKYFDALVSPPDHSFPSGTLPNDVRFHASNDHYKTEIPIKIDTSPGVRKPDRRVLIPLLEIFGVQPQEAVCIGDSLSRDVLMAQNCQVYDVLAKYGHIYDREHYAELLKITYWTDREVEEEMRLRAAKVTPSFVVSNFSEILDVVRKIESKNEP
jgi:phosphoglycolate phosphatase-like HAD superfamily hydrolase